MPVMCFGGSADRTDGLLTAPAEESWAGTRQAIISYLFLQQFFSLFFGVLGRGIGKRVSRGCQSHYYYIDQHFEKRETYGTKYKAHFLSCAFMIMPTSATTRAQNLSRSVNNSYRTVSLDSSDTRRAAAWRTKPS